MKVTGGVTAARTRTMPSDPSVIDVNSRGSSSTPRPPLIPNGYLVLATGSALVQFFISLSLSLFAADLYSVNNGKWGNPPIAPIALSFY